MLSYQQERAAKYLALGVPARQVAKLLGVSHQTLYNWASFEEFKAARVKFNQENVALLEDLLLEGEKQAVQTMLEALQAADAQGQPDWKIRMQAATRFLDSAGRRGKPIEKMESRHFELTGNVNEMMERALRDPGVVEYLKRLQPVPPLVDAEPEVPQHLEGQAVVEGDYEILPDSDGTSGSGHNDELRGIIRGEPVVPGGEPSVSQSH